MKRPFHFQFSLGVVSFGALLFAGCNKNYFSPLPQQALQPSSSQGSIGALSPGPGPGPGPGTSGGVGGTTATIQAFHPALAVRDFSCLACHANIQANVITDFGYGNSWYMGGYASPMDFGGTHYMATTWQTLEQIKGQVLVPSATVQSSFAQAELQSGSTLPAGALSLMSYLNLTDMTDFGGSWYAYFGEAVPATMAFTNNVQPGGGLAPVNQQSTVFIGSPTAAEILAIVPAPGGSGPWIQAKGASGPGLSGLSVATGVNGTSYVTNTGPIQCAGKDVVIDGTLLIENGQFYAGNNGCRLYVTGSVFVEGPITYLDAGATADPTENLQITSATSVILGVGLNGSTLNGNGTPDDGGVTPLQVRLLDDVRNNLLLRTAQTSSAYQTYATSILAEGENIGVALLPDASVPGTLPTAPSAAGQQRATIAFQHLLLNAPLIHSRYMGTFEGVIVAESAMFSLGEFQFSYDPVFQSVNVLPALPYDIVCTGSPCNPVAP